MALPAIANNNRLHNSGGAPRRAEGLLPTIITTHLLEGGTETICTTAFLYLAAIPQDLVNSLLLSETIYKVHDHGPQGAVKALQAMQSALPPGLSNIQKVQCSLPHVHHR